MIVQCCVCGKSRADGRWTRRAPREAETGEVSHGYCPACAARLFAEIRSTSEAERLPIAQ